ncbi:class I SAM-dependent methyltransferase [Allobranchiibius sp. CTAmp26]|uniref:class I SAM-dependent methyltransferase n=1 Tax=Allobranchiibius sp. CTAmp26 TaxID=2815214 RepID=UPI001AA164CC|nr:class I SAM-dependent methyltransferase [Allobranchiibius sp. CTAmp26]MBO1753823.1 methyltransferase domain-containing protein [Allobranchiibius sp. CTAmp26]
MSDPVRALYDTVATAYDEALANELDGKPLDRALLAGLVDSTGGGPVADLGCGPGQVAAQLRRCGVEHVVGIDLSPLMLAAGHARHSDLDFAAGDLRALPLADGVLAGATAFYSIVHLHPSQRLAVLREMARVLRPGGQVLVAFHVDAPGIPMGTAHREPQFLGHDVTFDGWFLDPDDIAEVAVEAGLVEVARCIRAPIPDLEYPSRRCYLFLARPA